MAIWVDDAGVLKVDSTGRPIECEECPCDDGGGGEVTCPPCCSGGISNTLIATLPSSGFSNGANCTACAALAGTSFVLSNGGAGCIWSYIEQDFCASCMGGEHFDLIVIFSLSEFEGRCVATLTVELHGPEDSDCRGDIVSWQRVYTLPAAFDCHGSNSLPHAFTSQDGPACGSWGEGNVTIAA